MTTNYRCSLRATQRYSQSSTDELLSAVDELINELANDEVLKPLFRVAIHFEIIGGDRTLCSLLNLPRSLQESLSK